MEKSSTELPISSERLHFTSEVDFILKRDVDPLGSLVGSMHVSLISWNRL